MSPGQRRDSADGPGPANSTLSRIPPPRPSSPPPFAPQAFDIEEHQFEQPTCRQLGAAFEPEGALDSDSDSDEEADGESMFSFEGPRRQPSSRYYKPQNPHFSPPRMSPKEQYDSSIYFDYDDDDLDEELNVWDTDEDMSHLEDNLIDEANSSCAVSDDEFWFCDSPPPPRRQASLVYRRMNSVVTLYDGASCRSKSQKSTHSSIAPIPE